MHLCRFLVLAAACLTVSLAASAQRSAPHGMHPLAQGGSNAYTISVLAPNDGSPKVGVGLAASLLVTVTPVDGYAQPVTLKCGDLPQEASCIFGLETIPAGGGSTTMLFNTAAPRDCGTSTPYFYGPSASLKHRPSLKSGPSLRYLAPALAGLLLLWPLRRRRHLRGNLLTLLLVAGTLTLNGCGHCTDLGTLPGTYTFTLSGTAENTVALALGDLVSVPVTVTVNQ